MCFRKILSIGLLLLASQFKSTAQDVKEPTGAPAKWSNPFPPFRIVGNLFYVGTEDLASYLITTNKGNILINTGLAASAASIKKNIASLGFRFNDIKILLTSQAHYDHVGAMAAIKEQTGAKMMVNEKDAKVLADGGATDYELAKYGITFKPVKADRLLHDGDTIQLGTTKLIMLHHPGHTKGSSSFLFTTTDNGRSYKVLIANFPTIIVDRKFSAVTEYPEMAADYAYTINAMKKLSFDLWVAAHGSQFQLAKKYNRQKPYDPGVFANKTEFYKQLDEIAAEYQKFNQ